MWRHGYNEDWERRKSYLIRSLFHDVPLLSPVPEESDDSSGDPPRPPTPIVYRPYSPLPPLIIEREPNRHDEPEEYYKVLEDKVKRIYKKLFIEGRELSDNDFIHDSDVDDSNLNSDLVNDSNHVAKNGYSADYESYESEVPSYHVEQDENNDDSYHNHVESSESSESFDDINNDSEDVTDENNNSKLRNLERDNFNEEHCETHKESIDLYIQEEVELEAGDSEITEDNSGSDYRQITTQAQIHVDGTQVETQSYAYEGSVRKDNLTLQRLGHVDVGEEGRAVSQRGDEKEIEESMAEEESVSLEDNDDPEDVEMAYNESAAENTEVEASHVIEDIEVMRTPQPKLSVDSIAHTSLQQSDVTGEYNVTHNASLITSDCDITKPTSPVLNVTFVCEDEDSGTGDSLMKKVSGNTVLDADVLSHVSPILNVIKHINVHRDRNRAEEDMTSDMDVTTPVSNLNAMHFDEVMNRGNIDTVTNIDLGKITTDTRVITPEPNFNVTSLNGDRDRKSENAASDADELRSETPIYEDVVMDAATDEVRLPGTPNLNKSFLNDDRVRKRKGEDVGVQTVKGRVGWEDLKTNLFVGAPKIFRLCSCSEHECIIPLT